MIHAFLVLSLALVDATEDPIITVEVKSRETVILPCVAKSKPGVEYVAVRWYKEAVDPRLTGLVTKDLPDGRMRWYLGASMEISLVNGTLNLQLPNVSCSDGGVYQCYLAAPVGQQNRQGHVRLTVTDCPREVEKTPEQELLLVVVAGVVLVIALGIFAMTYMRLKNMVWQKNKTLEKQLYPDLSCPLEKKQLIFSNLVILSPNPKISS